ncbi:MAG: membrane protein insertase YidC [Deltaproteobacteria bacterium]|nr:membrane protein insertase YidC [Deltaproteobacteria bacterium]
MEKRTVIAFVLSFLVLILWTSLFGPRQEPAPPQVEPDGKTQTQTRAATPVESAPIPPPALSQPVPETDNRTPASRQTEEKKITVETPLYRIIFTNAGPSIESFELKKYRQTTATDSPRVELIKLAIGHEKALQARFLSSDVRDGDQGMIYRTNEDSLRLDAQSPPRDLTFTATRTDGVTIAQTFRIDPERYPLDLTVTVQNPGQKNLNGQVRLTLRNLPAGEKQSYYAFAGIALLLEGKLKEIETDDMKKKPETISGQIGWVAYEDGHFMNALIPENPEKTLFEGRVLPSGVLQASYTGPTVSLGAQQQMASRFMLYFGPRDLSILEKMDKKLDLAINFGWTDIIAKPLLYAMRFFNRYVNNYGVSIIILTVLIKILFWPLTHKSYKSMKEMQRIQPLMAKIREKYKDNKEQMNREMMGLYKTYKVNPMGGCLPMVIQIPVFFALFRILGNSIELRHAPFILWINDLSAPDRLFHFPFAIPLMTPPYGIPVLTLLMGVSMFVQQKMTPTPGDPTQAKIMMFLPIIFTVMFINFPSGLVLYWLVNNILSIGQQYRIIRRSA